MGSTAASGRLARLLLASIALLLAGCDEVLLHERTEVEANEILVVLESHGIHATMKESKGGSKKGLAFDIWVDGAEIGRARRALSENNLPRPQALGYGAMLQDRPVIASPTEERARDLFAKQGELTNAIMAIPGVIEAKVNLVLPDSGTIDPTQRPAEARASVLVKYRERDPAELPQSVAERQKVEEEAYRDTLLALGADMKRLDVVLRQMEENQALQRSGMDDLKRLLDEATGAEAAAKAGEARRAAKALEQLQLEEARIHGSIRQIKRIREIETELERLGQVERRTLPFTEGQIQSIVAGGVRNLAPENVTVTITRNPRRAAALQAPPATGAARQKGLFIAALGGIALLALILVGLAIRVVSLKRQVAAQSSSGRAPRVTSSPAPAA